MAAHLGRRGSGRGARGGSAADAQTQTQHAHADRIEVAELVSKRACDEHINMRPVFPLQLFFVCGTGFVEVLSWFAFYSSPIPDQNGHSQAPGQVRSAHINIPYYIRSIEYHSQSGLWAGGFQLSRENVLSLVRDGHDACPQGLRVGTCALLARRLDSALARLCECESNFSTISREPPVFRMGA